MPPAAPVTSMLFMRLLSSGGRGRSSQRVDAALAAVAHAAALSARSRSAMISDIGGGLEPDRRRGRAKAPLQRMR
jgi:hypothetical protein